MKGRYQKQGVIFIKSINKNLSRLFISRHKKKNFTSPIVVNLLFEIPAGRNIHCRFINPTFPRN